MVSGEPASAVVTAIACKDVVVTFTFFLRTPQAIAGSKRYSFTHGSVGRAMLIAGRSNDASSICQPAATSHSGEKVRSSQMQTTLARQRDHRDRRRIIVIIAAAALLFTTVTLAGSCRMPPRAISIIGPVPTHPQAIKPVASAHIVVQAAVSASRKVSRVRAAVAQALLRLPTTPLSFLALFILLCVARVALFARSSRCRAGSPTLPHGQRRAQLQVFLI
jgi:hypothetical protein